MSYTTWRILWIPYNKKTLTWNTNNSVWITRFSDPEVIVNIGEGKDSFSFKIKNFNSLYGGLFNNNDRIIIYRTLNDNTFNSTTDILINGCINKIPEEYNEKNQTLKIEGYNYSETVMGALTFVDTNNLTIPNAIKAGLDNVKSFAKNFAVSWDNNNPMLKSDNTPFPVVNERFYNKPLKDFVEKLSKPDITQDGAYYWYVSVNNTLVWRKRTDVSTKSFSQQTTIHKSLKIDKDIKDVKNYVIVKGGKDLYNKSIQTKYFDASSMARHGAKYHVLVSEAKYFDNLINLDLSYYNVKSVDDLPFGTFRPIWNTTLLPSNKRNYNDALRNHVKNMLEQEAKNFVEARKYGKLKITIGFDPGQNWVLGDLITCTIPSISLNPKKLRVEEIKYSTKEDSYTLVEDVGTI